MYQKILAPLDGSEFSECSLQHVKAIATGCAVPDVVLLRVVEPIHSSDLTSYAEAGIDTSLYIREAESAAHEYLGKIAENLKKSGLQAEGVVTVGWAADTIMNYADQNGVDLIILSTHGRGGVGRWFMGSVADKVVRHSKVPVLTVSPPGCRGELPK
jgi:nucleotide-binding universal stress UspA family protein